LPAASLDDAIMARLDTKIGALQHYIVRNGRAYWFPTAQMRAEGFRCIPCGPDDPEAVKIAAQWNPAARPL
jgi:hypothetical protein